ncbi:MinD/ParA family protein [Kurthia sibirica]|uniref:ATPase n=1 Tax=Kurthia sibirica TaxID=202750 RepID=A0A2U3AQW3_9BACL|nr:MinD/ParA family protein [Kurthia sibirica]PWI26914.1 ATPase [Kurthia sibirica]GEK32544.1 site-determining protein [Kurthia sibirica]
MDQAERLRHKMMAIDKISCKTIAVVSGKGGVGKSNFSTNFSIALAQLGHKVLVVDMDIGMGNIHILLGKSARNSLTHYLQGECTIQEVIHQDTYGIDFIAGGSGMSSILRWSDFMFERLIFAFNELQKNYDYILFDMGAGATEWSLQFIMAVDDIVVISTTEPTSVTDAYSMMKYIHTKDESKQYYVVSNRAFTIVEGQDSLQRLATTMQRFLNNTIQALGVIPEDMQVRKAIQQQKPFKALYPSAHASKAIDRIARIYVNGLQDEHMAQQTHEPFLSKLRNLFSKGRA